MENNTWNLIPQVFYDFLARVIPGAVLIVVTILVIFSPAAVADSMLNSPNSSKLLDAGPLILWLLGSYIIGFLLGQFWHITLGRLAKKKYSHIEIKCKKECLAEHNRLQKALLHPQLAISVNALPRTSVMQEHLRHIVPADVARLLKVRAECRLCQVLFLGFSALSVINMVYCVSQWDIARVILEVLLIIAITTCWYGGLRLHNFLTNGTIISWLIHAPWIKYLFRKLKLIKSIIVNLFLQLQLKKLISILLSLSLMDSVRYGLFTQTEDFAKQAG